MTLPGGSSFDALRLKESLTVAGMTSVSYLFISKSGAQVSLFASDPNPPLSGVINLEGYSYNGTFGITGVEEENELLINFSLDQNYPNPFNPSTKIKYTIPNVSLSEVEGSRVQLKVYDVLGNEVATLVNESKPVGTYEVEFNASNISSGVYFYKLQSGNFVETRKMILLK
ncbi:MAG: T9SS type A sorting domain-containing protein [Ignavibacteriales bacterium]|nr:T9SS type A sorting domain-containing protein [Ignavibacteriales bacterium]